MNHSLINVTGWDDDPSNFGPESAPGTYNFHGAVALKTDISNPNDLKVTQTVHTRRISESLVFNDSEIEISRGESKKISLTVTCKAPYTETNAWSSQVTYKIFGSNSETQNCLPRINADGTIITTSTTHLETIRLN